jgi:hypothetical protein
MATTRGPRNCVPQRPQEGAGLFSDAQALIKRGVAGLSNAAGKAAEFASGETVTKGRNLYNKGLSAVGVGNPKARPLYPGEKHAAVLSGPGVKGTSYNFMGPGTQLQKRLERGDVGINSLDAIAMKHDQDYDKAVTAADVRKADKVFMAGARRQAAADPKVAQIALATFKAKMAAEDAGALDPMTFAQPLIGGGLLKQGRRLQKGRSKAFA